LNFREPKIIEQLAYFSVKYNVYLSELYQALISARKIGKSHCGNLTVEYRGIIKGQLIFLITKVKVVVAQFRVGNEFLSRENIIFENWLNTDKVRKQLNRQNDSFEFTLIQNLRHGMKKVNLTAEVLEAQEPQSMNTQYGNRLTLTDIWLGDETGKVKLCLWGEQAISSPVVGDMVQIVHAKVRTFREERILSLGKMGRISIQAKATGAT
jgi:hypothetical protein